MNLADFWRCDILLLIIIAQNAIKTPLSLLLMQLMFSIPISLVILIYLIQLSLYRGIASSIFLKRLRKY